MTFTYTCVTCGHTMKSQEVLYQCPDCARSAEAGFPRGYLSITYSPQGRKAKGSPIEPLEMLPCPVRHIAAYPVGGTPLVQTERLRAATGFPRLHVKCDSSNPSGSLKDRASLLVAELAAAKGEKRVALASTGNAGASMACAGAAYGLDVVLFVPAAAPRAKLLQSLLYGARVVPVEGTYDDAYTLSIEYTSECGGMNRNTGWNPFTVEGKKTVSIEIYNQLHGRVPDALYVPTGDGVIFSGACKGFVDLMAAGCTDRMPLMVSVQAEGSNAIARSWREGRECVLAGTSTIADSLSVCRPASGVMALDYLRRYKGRAVEVSDAEIRSAQAQLARDAGVFVEPSSAAAWAGFLRDKATLDPSSEVVVLLTGTGFKDTAAAEKLVAMPPACPVNLESALRLLADSYGLGK
jgi:threonine synthase